MLNRKILSVITAAGVVGFGVISSNVFAADGTGNASATIVAPLSVAEDVAMSFGDISPDETNPSTVTVDLVNGVSNTGAFNAGLVGGTVASGQFTASGAGNLAITVSFTAGTLTCTTPLTCGASTMGVSNFTDNAAAALTAGTEQFEVGADLAVGANQADGDYAGTYTVTVEYN